VKLLSTFNYIFPPNVGSWKNDQHVKTTGKVLKFCWDQIFANVALIRNSFIMKCYFRGMLS